MRCLLVLSSLCVALVSTTMIWPNLLRKFKKPAPNAHPPREQASLTFLLMERFLASNVVVQQTVHRDRPSIRVRLTDGYQRHIRQSGQVQRAHGCVQIPVTCFYQGIIQVDVAVERNSKADRLSRGYAGIAFRKQSDRQYELVYLRATNGRLNRPQPEGERSNRAVQYASPPDWTYDQLRHRFPSQYEAGADIGEGQWHRLKIVVANQTLTVLIDEHRVMEGIRLMGTHATGSLGYWVDDGTDAYFANLHIHEY